MTPCPWRPERVDSVPGQADELAHVAPRGHVLVCLGDVGQRVGVDGQEIEIARLDPVQGPLKHLCRQALGLPE